MNWDSSLVKSVSCRERYLAKANDVKILHSSAGCQIEPAAQRDPTFRPVDALSDHQCGQHQQDAEQIEQIGKCREQFAVCQQNEHGQHHRNDGEHQLLAIIGLAREEIVHEVAVGLVLYHEDAQDAQHHQDAVNDHDSPVDPL